MDRFMGTWRGGAVSMVFKNSFTWWSTSTLTEGSSHLPYKNLVLIETMLYIGQIQEFNVDVSDWAKGQIPMEYDSM